ncbi:MAG TPA: type II toxin-antitoxin system VapB family antitoxin [Polyangiaceae bacterium]
MRTTKVFQSGNSQAVRIPVEFQFDVPEVEIERRGNEIVLRPPRLNLMDAFNALADLPSDCFPDERDDSVPQERESL